MGVCVNAEDVICLHDDRKRDEEHRGAKMSDRRPVVTGNIKPVEPLTSFVLWANSPVQGDKMHLLSVVGLSGCCTEPYHGEA